MKKFRSTSDTLQVPPAQEIVEALLVEAGAAGRFPTDEKKLLGFLKLEQLTFDFMHELDFLPKPQDTRPEIRAALSLNDRLVATQTGLGDKRKRFGIFHEIGHFILPEHRQKLFLDDDITLSWWARVQIEREANEIAAELLFQGNRFTEEAVNAPTSARTVIDLAPKYGASFESALRRYTERHVLPCALIVFTKIKEGSDEAEFEEAEYRIHYTITSSPFRKHYFSGLEVKGDTIKGAELCDKGRWWGINDIVEKELVVQSAEKHSWHFETEMFTNSYKLFQFVLPPEQAIGT